MSYNGIRTIHIEVARDICNIRCNFCYIDFKPEANEPYDYEGLNKVVNYCRSHDVETVTIQGGEITAIPEGYTFCKELQEVGCSLNVMTNGVRLNEGWFDIFSSSCHRVNISINTSTPETYKEIVGFDGWKTVYNNIARINELRKVNNPNCEFSISMVIVKQNFHEVVDFYRMSRELGVDYICLFPDISSKEMIDMRNPTLRAKGKEMYVELRDLMKSHAPIHAEDLVALQIFRNFVGFKETEPEPEVAPRHQFTPTKKINPTPYPHDLPGEKTYCKMPSTMVYINHSMDVFTCCGATGIKYGNLKTHELDEIMEDKKRNDLQARVKSGDYSSCSRFCSLMPRS